MFTLRKQWYPFVGPFDPCKPITCKSYSTPPQLYINFQPPNLPQFSPKEALCKGTLWPIFYDPWYNPYEKAKREEKL
ncbi:spore coat associated protein CotJA [Fredinandcohnia quinoae]|uniref:Spore coat associated protein CotJA n=1 Tax=Fredinandcohnia quinoae TaxID=2918902 RepID=A0AAW5DXI6_9BACI|nr:spore coat associated protein CotJA [Fredinandcohnia sp. SECRCQ15]MCH1624778.1 spore coat associated protein CotJA [Fredinandcohnia sp. SECRCQ15]